jgi:hypothetical protein
MLHKIMIGAIVKKADESQGDQAREKTLDAARVTKE